MKSAQILLLVAAVTTARLYAQSDAEEMIANLLGEGASPTGIAAVVPAAPVLATNQDITVVGEEPEVGVDTGMNLQDIVDDALRTAAPSGTADEISIYPDDMTPPITGVAPALAEAAALTTTPEQITLPLEAVSLRPYVKPGTIVGNVRDHENRTVPNVKVVLFNDAIYKTMQTTPGGNFGFNITEPAAYTLTASIGNQFFYTNMYLVPGDALMVRVRFKMPITVYGQLFVDGAPAQYGLFLRLVNAEGAQAGGVVLSNGLFRIAALTPERYTLVLERRKMFIDRRLDESRFYFVPLTMTTETMRIRIERDRRNLSGRITFSGLPQRHVDAIVILRDARTNGKLIYREAPTYFTGGSFFFDHIQPGAYTLTAVQRRGQWQSDPQPFSVSPMDGACRVNVDVVLDKDAARKQLDQLRKQFMPYSKE